MSDALALHRTAYHMRRHPGVLGPSGMRAMRLAYTVLTQLPEDGGANLDYPSVLPSVAREVHCLHRAVRAHGYVWETAALLDLVQRYSVDNDGDGRIEAINLSEIGGWTSELEPPWTISEIAGAIEKVHSDWLDAIEVADYPEFLRRSNELGDRARMDDGSVVGALRAGSLYQLMEIGFRQCVATQRAMLVVLRCHHFRRRAGKWPASMQEVLTEDEISLGHDPFGGEFIYRVRDDAMQLYSVGIDGCDQGGRALCQDGRQKWALLLSDTLGDYVFWPPVNCLGKDTSREP